MSQWTADPFGNYCKEIENFLVAVVPDHSQVIIWSKKLNKIVGCMLEEGRWLLPTNEHIPEEIINLYREILIDIRWEPGPCGLIEGTYSEWKIYMTQDGKSITWKNKNKTAAEIVNGTYKEIDGKLPDRVYRSTLAKAQQLSSLGDYVP